MEFKFNCLKPLLFLIVCICLCITSSYAFAGDADNITLGNVADIGIADEDNIIGSDFNQIGAREIILGNSTDGFIDDNTFDVVYSQILYSYSTGVNADPVECGGFVFFENCTILVISKKNAIFYRIGIKSDGVFLWQLRNRRTQNRFHRSPKLIPKPGK